MTRPLFAGACLLAALLGCSPGVAPTPAVAAQPAPSATSSGEAVSPAGVVYHATELRPGDCIEPMPESFMVTVVPCTVPHSAEYGSMYVIADGPWPGTAEIRRLAENGCGPRMRYVASRREEVGFLSLMPLEQEWPKYRTAYCLAVAGNGGKLVGRVLK